SGWPPRSRPASPTKHARRPGGCWPTAYGYGTPRQTPRCVVEARLRNAGRPIVAGMTDTVHHNLAGQLRGHFRGTLLEPGDEGYSEARRVWNGAIDRRPALIARVAGADDVQAAVR